MSNPYYTYADENGIKRSTIRVSQNLVANVLPESLKKQKDINFDILLGESKDGDVHAVAMSPESIEKIKKAGIAPIDLFSRVAKEVKNKIMNGDIDGMLIQSSDQRWCQIKEVFAPDSDTSDNKKQPWLKF